MEGEFIPYEQALALKELGFNEPCLGYYVGKDKEVYMSNEILSAPFQFRLESKTTFVAQTFSQAFRWFRDKYDLRIWIESKSPILFEYTIATSNAVFLNMVFEDNSFYGTHEEAELECLKKLIEIVNNGKRICRI